MQALNSSIEHKLRQSGASLVGFADISGLPAEKTGGLPRAISMAVALDPAVVREIRNGPTPRYFAEYARLNQLLGELGDRAASMIRSTGARAEPIRATGENFDPITLSMRVQHKTIATRAGLGWIGKSALLITKEYGSAVRLASVLTDADINVGTPVDASGCGDCHQCVDGCPAGAIVGEVWHAGMERDCLCNAKACWTTARKLAAGQGIPATICGICVHACPWTRHYLERESKVPVEIAPVTTEDLEAARKLCREYEAGLPFRLSFQDFEGELAGLPGRYAAPNGQMLLANCDGDSIGCVALRQIGAGVCEMKRLFVRPAFRGRGIGNALARAIIEEARRIGYKRMRLDTVLEPAQSLYRSLGFREIPPYQQVPIEGVVFMELEL